MKHALILGGSALFWAWPASSWGKGMGPTWYPIALMVLALPQSWAGSRLYETYTAGKAQPGKRH